MMSNFKLYLNLKSQGQQRKCSNTREKKKSIGFEIGHEQLTNNRKWNDDHQNGFFVHVPIKSY